MNRVVSHTELYCKCFIIGFTCFLAFLKMKNKLILPFLFILIGCSNCKMANKQSTLTELLSEGYIQITINTYSNLDNNGLPINHSRVNDSNSFSIKRRMYLHNQMLIDIIITDNYSNGKFIKSDTTGYTFFDLASQKFATFRTLSTDSDLIKKGSLDTPGGGFSNNPKFDPMNGVPDSTWKVKDTVINGDSIGIINFSEDGLDTTEMMLSKGSMLWVNYGIRNFPLQISYSLSRKLNNSFVYKMQQPFPDGKSVMITSFDYQPAKLPNNIIKIFDTWSKVVNQ